MFLLPPFLRKFLAKRREGKESRVYLKDDQLVLRVKKIATDQRRAEQEIYEDIIAAGMKALQDKSEYAGIWDSLSERERQVTAMTCLGYRSYEIAGMLGISYETVRTHSKHIYAKFGLNRDDLRLALKDWDFHDWLDGGE